MENLNRTRHNKSTEDVTQGLTTAFEPFAWLAGQWEGIGTGNSIARKPFYFKNCISFDLLPGVKEGCILNFEEMSWPMQKTQKFKHLEVGFFKLEKNSEVQFCACYSTGEIENYYGKFESVNKDRKRFKALFRGDCFDGESDCPESARQNEITLTLSGGVLRYTLTLSTGRNLSSYHLNSNFSKA